MQQPEKGQRFAHQLVRVEGRLAHSLIGDTRALKGLDQQATLRAQPVKHREIGEGARRGSVGAAHPAGIQRKIAGAAYHLFDLVHDIFGLGLVRRRAGWTSSFTCCREIGQRLGSLQRRRSEPSGLPRDPRMTCTAASRISWLER